MSTLQGRTPQPLDGDLYGIAEISSRGILLDYSMNYWLTVCVCEAYLLRYDYAHAR